MHKHLSTVALTLLLAACRTGLLDGSDTQPGSPTNMSGFTVTVEPLGESAIDSFAVGRATEFTWNVADKTLTILLDGVPGGLCTQLAGGIDVSTPGQWRLFYGARDSAACADEKSGSRVRFTVKSDTLPTEKEISVVLSEGSSKMFDANNLLIPESLPSYAIFAPQKATTNRIGNVFRVNPRRTSIEIDIVGGCEVQHILDRVSLGEILLVPVVAGDFGCERGAALVTDVRDRDRSGLRYRIASYENTELTILDIDDR